MSEDGSSSSPEMVSFASFGDGERKRDACEKGPPTGNTRASPVSPEGQVAVGHLTNEWVLPRLFWILFFQPWLGWCTTKYTFYDSSRNAYHVKSSRYGLSSASEMESLIGAPVHSHASVFTLFLHFRRLSVFSLENADVKEKFEAGVRASPQLAMGWSATLYSFSALITSVLTCLAASPLTFAGWLANSVPNSYAASYVVSFLVKLQYATYGAIAMGTSTLLLICIVYLELKNKLFRAIERYKNLAYKALTAAALLAVCAALFAAYKAFAKKPHKKVKRATSLYAKIVAALSGKETEWDESERRWYSRWLKNFRAKFVNGPELQLQSDGKPDVCLSAYLGSLAMTTGALNLKVFCEQARDFVFEFTQSGYEFRHKKYAKHFAISAGLAFVVYMLNELGFFSKVVNGVNEYCRYALEKVGLSKAELQSASFPILQSDSDTGYEWQGELPLTVSFIAQALRDPSPSAIRNLLPVYHLLGKLGKDTTYVQKVLGYLGYMAAKKFCLQADVDAATVAKRKEFMQKYLAAGTLKGVVLRQTDPVTGMSFRTSVEVTSSNVDELAKRDVVGFIFPNRTTGENVVHVPVKANQVLNRIWANPGDEEYYDDLEEEYLDAHPEWAQDRHGRQLYDQDGEAEFSDGDDDDDGDEYDDEEDYLRRRNNLDRDGPVNTREESRTYATPGMARRARGPNVGPSADRRGPRARTYQEQSVELQSSEYTVLKLPSEAVGDGTVKVGFWPEGDTEVLIRKDTLAGKADIVKTLAKGRTTAGTRSLNFRLVQDAEKAWTFDFPTSGFNCGTEFQYEKIRKGPSEAERKIRAELVAVRKTADALQERLNSLVSERKRDSDFAAYFQKVDAQGAEIQSLRENFISDVKFVSQETNKIASTQEKFEGELQSFKHTTADNFAKIYATLKSLDEKLSKQQVVEEKKCTECGKVLNAFSIKKNHKVCPKCYKAQLQSSGKIPEKARSLPNSPRAPVVRVPVIDVTKLKVLQNDGPKVPPMKQQTPPKSSAPCANCGTKKGCECAQKSALFQQMMEEFNQKWETRKAEESKNA